MDAIQPFLFWFLAGLTSLTGLATVLTQNIVRCATWLLFTLAGVSAIFFLLGADLVGAIQLLVYVGGTLVLVVFGVMLTAQGPFINMKTSSAEWAISAAAGLMLLGVLCVAITKLPTEKQGMLEPPKGSTAQKFAPNQRLSKNPESAQYTVAIGQGLLGLGVGPAHDQRGVHRPERPIPVRTNYLWPFEIVSIHLLVVLIGAAYLARAKRRPGGAS